MECIAVDKVNKEIVAFIETRGRFPNNRWFEGGGLAIYIRNTTRYVEGEVGPEAIPAIDIANIDVKEALQNAGIFTRCLNAIEDVAARLHLCCYIENILSERFERFFEKRGYLYVEPRIPRSPCMFRRF